MIAHWKYLKYVLRHKWYVFLACLHYGLIWQGITHDWSKFLPSEWFPYAIFFNTDKQAQWEWQDAVSNSNGLGGLDPATSPKSRFDAAWNHHQKRQPHHWQYWMLTMDVGDTILLPMPLRYRQEMIADWRGASMAITGVDDTLNWYLKNKDKMRLHPVTRKWAEVELGVQL